MSHSDSAYFVPGGVAVGDIADDLTVTIAQFSYFDSFVFEFGGGIQFNNGEQFSFYECFVCPVPGVLAVFVLAGMGFGRQRAI